MARTRQRLREILVGPLTVTADGTADRFDDEVLFDRLTHGTTVGTVVLPTFLARATARTIASRTSRAFLSFASRSTRFAASTST
jgi:hypothetical protein